MKTDVAVFFDKPRIGTFTIAQGLDKDHSEMKKLIEKYRKEFEDFSGLKTRKLSSTGGRPVEEFMLDEDQFMFLGTLLRNSPKVVKFKQRIILEFKKCRKKLTALGQHKSEPKYQVSRDAGKLVRRETTDVIKEFIEYAKSQGSKNADQYYMVISKMLNSLLFIVEGRYKNVRDMLTVRQLMTISSAEQIVERALSLGMKKNKYYKEIYKDARKKVELFAEMHGKSEVVKDLPLEIEPS